MPSYQEHSNHLLGLSDRESSLGSWILGFLVPSRRSAFTLVELILVMAVLATILAIVAPMISRSMRDKNLDQQASRLLALTEYSRDEAASQGVPVVVWVDPDTRHFGADVKTGYNADAMRAKEYTLPADLGFDPPQGGVASKAGGHGFDVAEFAPDGTLDPSSATALRIVNVARKTGVNVNQTADAYGYEIVKEAAR